jgi:hypothetical protein
MCIPKHWMICIVRNACLGAKELRSIDCKSLGEAQAAFERSLVSEAIERCLTNTRTKDDLILTK